jgi:hypothetical protein
LWGKIVFTLHGVLHQAKPSLMGWFTIIESKEVIKITWCRITLKKCSCYNATCCSKVDRQWSRHVHNMYIMKIHKIIYWWIFGRVYKIDLPIYTIPISPALFPYHIKSMADTSDTCTTSTYLEHNNPPLRNRCFQSVFSSTFSTRYRQFIHFVEITYKILIRNQNTSIGVSTKMEK